MREKKNGITAVLKLNVERYMKLNRDRLIKL